MTFDPMQIAFAIEQSASDDMLWGCAGEVNPVTYGRLRAARLTSRALINASRRLRFRVYCQERAFLSASEYPDGTESDQYDLSATQFGVFLDDVSAESMIACARLVPGALRLPLHRYCILSPGHRKHLSTSPRAAEVSRLCLKSDISLGGGSRPSLAFRKDLLIALYKAMYVWVKDAGITHLYAAMEPALARLAWRSGFPFIEVGPEADYYGRVYPYMLDIAHMEMHLRQEAPKVWEFFLKGGSQNRPVLAVAQA